ncbi:MAG TPA: glycosyltransferase [Chryseolinea sp.]|nr:glycosyltransferase [Chryseolinea sp.]
MQEPGTHKKNNLVLGIISDCVHIRNSEGVIGSKVHVLVKQLDHLSTYFEQVYICAPVLNGNDNQSAISVYENKNIVFIPIPLAGGNSIVSKLKLALVLPVWIFKIILICSKSDLVYLRAPNNISIPGFAISSLFRKKKFSTFTGTWNGYKSEPFTYALQRKYLSKYFNGPVFVYGRLPSDRENIHNTISPSYSMDDWCMETTQVEGRVQSLAHQNVFARGINLITVGSLTDNKNQIFILEAMTKLKMLKVKFVLWVAGEGENLKRYENFVRENNLQEDVFFLGNIKQDQLREYYRKADIIVQAPIHEGFGKVPIEGFFHGVIPVISNVNLSGKIVGDNKRGRVFNTQDELIGHIRSLMHAPSDMIELIKNGREYARENTLEAWGREILCQIK